MSPQGWFDPGIENEASPEVASRDWPTPLPDGAEFLLPCQTFRRYCDILSRRARGAMLAPMRESEAEERAQLPAFCPCGEPRRTGDPELDWSVQVQGSDQGLRSLRACPSCGTVYFPLPSLFILDPAR